MIRAWFLGQLAALRVLLAITLLVGLVYPFGLVAVGRLPGLRDGAEGSLITDERGRVVGSRLIGQSFEVDGEPLPRYFQSRPSAAIDPRDGAPYDPAHSGASNLGPENVVDRDGATSLLTRVCRRSHEVGRLEGVDGSRPYCARGENSAVGAVLGVFYSKGLRGRVTRAVSLNEPCGAVTTPFLRHYRGVTVECARPGADYSKAVVTPVRGDAPRRPSVPPDAVAGSASGLDPHVSVAYARLQIQRVADARDVTFQRVAALVDDNTAGRALGFIGEPVVNVVTLNVALDERFGRPG